MKKDMEPLFTTQSKNTREEFIRFNRTIMKKEFYTTRKLIAINILYTLAVIGSLWVESYCLSAAFMLLIVYFNWKATKGADRRAAKTFEQNKVCQETTCRYSFYDDHFVVETENGMESVTYAKLYKIIETETNFYLMYSKIQGVILTKERFPDGLSDFLRSLHR